MANASTCFVSRNGIHLDLLSPVVEEQLQYKQEVGNLHNPMSAACSQEAD